jgi:hypothetical protein
MECFPSAGIIDAKHCSCQTLLFQKKEIKKSCSEGPHLEIFLIWKIVLYCVNIGNVSGLIQTGC